MPCLKDRTHASRERRKKKGASNKRENLQLTVLKERMANRLAIMVEKPGARQLWAMKPSLSSAKQMTSSPRFQSQLGMFKR